MKVKIIKGLIILFLTISGLFVVFTSFLLLHKVENVEKNVVKLVEAQKKEDKRKQELANNYIKNYAKRYEDNIKVIKLYKECNKDKKCLLEKMEEQNIETYKDLYKKEGENKNEARFRN